MMWQMEWNFAKLFGSSCAQVVCHIYFKSGILWFLSSADMDSSGPHNVYKSPRNIWIATGNLQNEGGPWISYSHPCCVLSFTTPNGLRKHFQASKHKFNSYAQSPPSSAHLLQRYKPQLMVETSGKTPHVPKVSSFKKPTPLHSDSEASDQESVTHYEHLAPLPASTTQSSPLYTLRTPSPQPGTTTAGHRLLMSPFQTSQTTTNTSTSTTLSFSSSFYDLESSSLESSSSESSSSTTSLSSLSGTCRMDEQGNTPPVSCDNTLNDTLMDIDYHPLDDGTISEDDFLGRNQLQEDKEDNDGVSVSQILHLLLDSKSKLSLNLTGWYWLFI